MNNHSIFFALLLARRCSRLRDAIKTRRRCHLADIQDEYWSLTYDMPLSADSLFPSQFPLPLLRRECTKAAQAPQVSKMSSTMGTVEGRVDLAEMEKIYQCPVCLELPICKIYQCKEGHLICEDCFHKMQNERNWIFVKCPTCSTNIPVPPIRCRTAEQVINKYTSN